MQESRKTARKWYGSNLSNSVISIESSDDGDSKLEETIDSQEVNTPHQLSDILRNYGGAAPTTYPIYIKSNDGSIDRNESFNMADAFFDEYGFSDFYGQDSLARAVPRE